MLVTRGQSAWAFNIKTIKDSIIFRLRALPKLAVQALLFSTISSSETTREKFDSKDSIQKNTMDWFYQWFVGVVDGDGSFTITCSNGKWSLYFKIGQSTYNLRLLHYIKSKLGVGSVYVDPDNNMASYRLRRVDHIVKYLLPIFDSNPLLTSKYYNYNLFKQAALILNDNSISNEEKNQRLVGIKALFSNIPAGYISPAWRGVNSKVTNIADAQSVISKPWIVGFTEAEGSFYLYLKGPKQLNHGFTITQKLDKIVLESIGFIFGIKVSVKNTHFSLSTGSGQILPFIINYYANTMKGMKALEYRIWSRSFNKKIRGKGFEDLSKVQQQMRNIRSIRLDKNWKISHYKTSRFT